jgi:ABC-2 type transport system ATP-binding protein
MNKTAISVENISVSKQKHVLLRNLSFSVKPGVICGLLGPSGAGKTTLMRVLVGLQASHDGNVSVLGSQPGSKQNRRKIGYVTQSPSIYPDLTVIQNVAYFAKLTGVGTPEAKRTLEMVHLSSKSKQLVATLSGGEKTRASLAVALLGDPELLIMDEPTVGLDPLLRRDLWRLFKTIAASGKTLLISSHVMDEAAQSEQLLLLRDGQLLWSDSQEKLLEATKQNSVEDAFIRLVKAGKT